MTRYYDAQASIIGSLLIDPEQVAGRVFRAVSPDDFSDAALRNLFRAAKDLYLADRPIDPVTVLDRAGQGYTELVKSAMAATPTVANIDAYLAILRDSSRLRRLQGLAEKMLDAVSWDEGRQLLARAGDLLTDRPGRRAATYTELVSDYLDRQSDKTPPRYLDWGIEQLNRQLTVSPGRFVILGADSSVGKTALALQLALHMARTLKVGFFSYETSREDAADRLLANAADVNLPRTKYKALTAADYTRVTAEGERSAGVQFTIVETAGYTVDELRSEVMAKRYDVVFIDYVQLVPSRASDRWQVVTEVSMALHTMAQQLGVTVIALSQVTPPEVNSETGSRRALRKGNLRESRQLINDADVILMMDLENPNEPQGLRTLAIDKNKDGPLGKLCLKFDPEHMRFTYSPPPKSETYKAIDKAVAEAKREHRKKMENQVELTELPDSSEPLPF